MLNELKFKGTELHAQKHRSTEAQKQNKDWLENQIDAYKVWQEFSDRMGFIGVTQ